RWRHAGRDGPGLRKQRPPGIENGYTPARVREHAHRIDPQGAARVARLAGQRLNRRQQSRIATPFDAPRAEVVDVDDAYAQKARLLGESDFGQPATGAFARRDFTRTHAIRRITVF